MTKIASWGRWIVGLVAVAIAAGCWGGVVYDLISTPHEARFVLQVLAAILGLGSFGALAFFCAWGVVKWQRWGHLLALGLFGFELYSGGLALLIGDSGPLYPLAACTILVWLLLPSVRREYWRKEQIA